MLTVICFRYFIWFGDVESWKQLRFEDDEEVEVLISEDLSQDCSKCLLEDRENMLFCISIVQMIFSDPPWPYTMILLVLIPLLSETTYVRVDSLVRREDQTIPLSILVRWNSHSWAQTSGY